MSRWPDFSPWKNLRQIAKQERGLAGLIKPSTIGASIGEYGEILGEESPKPAPKPKICVMANCDKRVYAKEKCIKHYRASLPKKKCLVDNCEKYVAAKGLCITHYQQQHRKKMAAASRPKQAAGFGSLPERRPADGEND